MQARIMAAEMSRSLTFERMRFPKKLSSQILKQLQDGAAITYEQYAKDLLITQVGHAAIQDLFAHHLDLIIAPSAIGEAPASKESTGDPIFCRTWTLLGLPCINLNITTGANGLPVGVQLIAGPGQDRFLLSAARAFARSLSDPVSRDQA